MRYILFLLSLLAPYYIVAQQITVKGIVINKETKQPLAFVNILSDNTGATTDIDGKFTIKTDVNNCCLKFSYIGYEHQNYTIDYESNTQLISLLPKTINLSEVKIFPGENPAHRIINNVIDNRNINNPEKIPAFTYTSYDKMVFTIDADSLLKKDTALLDTNELKVRKFINKQDLFIMESVTERKYMSPGLNQETVIATKVSGLNDPIMAFMVSQVQSTSFYDELIEIAGNKYVNPISKGSTKSYFFLIEDTTYTQTNDTVFVISFRPKKGTKFVGMTGFLHINSNRWAIQNVKAEPQNDSTGITIKIQQGYQFIQNHWFPSQLNTDIIFRIASVNDGENNYPLIGRGLSYIRDVDLNPELKKRDFGYHEIEIDEEATNRKAEYWQDYRANSLTQRELETYRIIDSIGKAQNFDRMAATFQTLITGKIPMGFLDIDFDKVFHYNQYEGFYLGLGLQTNQKVSKTFTLGGYWGYGFKDKSAKYGGNIAISIHKPSDSKLNIKAYNTVIASGETQFFSDKLEAWRPEYFYEFFVKQMNTTVGADINYSFRVKPFRDFKWNIGAKIQNKDAFEDYYFTSTSSPNDAITTYNINSFSAGFRFAFREKILQTTKSEISLGSKFPIVWFNYSQGVSGWLDGDYSYNRFDLKIEYNHLYKYFGESKITIKTGFIQGQLPISNLYSSAGTYGGFTIYAPSSFGTMRVNEFYSDKYVSLFLEHNFKDLLFSFGSYKPEFIVVTNIALGSLSNPQNHHNINFNTLEKGYYESGFLVRKLLNLQLYDLGLGVLYRYGPYGFDKQYKNFAYKLSLYYAF